MILGGAMRAPGSEDAVVIEKGKKAGEPHVITVNCPDRTGLGCDICRIVLDFGLYIKKGDVTTDGVWCYIVLWVVPHYDSLILRWSHGLKTQLLSVCPSCPTFFLLNLMSPSPTPTSVYLLNFFCLDRTGLLHDVTQVLTELELSIQSVKVTTTPDERVLDLFFITDNLDLLHTKKRQDETLVQFRSVLGESCISCELKLAGPEYEYHQKIPSLSPEVAEELFMMSEQLTDEEDNRAQALSDDMIKMKKNSSVTVDNSLSPSHTLLQIRCADHRGLLYDVLRTLKDFNVKISYGRFLPRTQGHRDIERFVQVKDEKKILDPDKQSSLCLRLKAEMLHPLRVIITNRGPDTELVVANPVELSGKGRPRVFYDVTLSLKVLGICVFSAEIRRYTAGNREWEVYRFLLDENCLFQLGSASVRNEIANQVRRTLMGW
ncbi:PREDICTED: ACT domain-containing protein ACR9-like [Brassica oleracea var. oleracea]|uniref:ACT domain-containing protein ACR n=1 Tax=Brassica oleracea var. oleracea TaxID=109376 RepID=A0A0D3A8P7_BRAOL|nr:PREDICTED: ACT domain-containing protein ACR9-like [Brassica oleracea var. oleracea]